MERKYGSLVFVLLLPLAFSWGQELSESRMIVLSPIAYEQLLNNLRQAGSKLESWNDSLTTRENGLSKRESDLNGIEKNLIERESDLNTRESLISEKQGGLELKELRLSEREANLSAREASLPENEKIISGLKDSLTKASESLKTSAIEAQRLENQVFFLKIAGGVGVGIGIAGLLAAFLF